MYRALADYCLSRKGAEQDYPFGPSPLVVKVGGKMFALLSEPGDGGNAGISLKCDPIIAENLREQHEAVQPGYHLNKMHWNTVILDGSLPAEDIQNMIEHSYDLVYRGLKKDIREQIAAG